MHYKKRPLKHLFILPALFAICTAKAHSEQDDLLNLSVEDLLNVEVISVAKKAKSLNDSPAAIYVISHEDIKRVGATSIPEALRLAPGLNVARIDSNKWAVSARGFNGRFANKLLVLIDGRNTYTRTFAGVYWENQDIMLEDIDRIEVIRGPGATLWGANAVNGVINIITKHSADTQGGLLAAGGGTEEQGFGSFRYGTHVNTDTTARAYIKGFKRDESTLRSGGEAGDDWDKVQGGFRLDSQISESDSLTIQGDAYRSILNQQTTQAQLSSPFGSIFNESIDSFGGNLLARQQHTFSSTSDYSLQVFYDFYERDETFLKESRQVLDIDFQHRFSFLDWNDVVWGAGYRYNHDQFRFSETMVLSPPSRNDQLFSAFIQDEITLLDNKLWLTLGSKVEYNDYSGFEVQPTARLMWALHNKHRLWTAVSRAVRTPSRTEQDMRLLELVRPGPVAIFLDDSDEFSSEELISYELGYRTTAIDNVSVDFTAFYNEYNQLRSVETAAPVPKPGYIEVIQSFANNNRLQTYGLEIATVWQMLEWWRWDANYSLLKMEFDGQKIPGEIGLGPQQQVSVRSALSLQNNINLDVFFRFVDRNRTTGSLIIREAKHYVSLDIRLAWHPINDIELSLTGQNLLAEHHMENQQEIFVQPTEIDRGMYGKFVWQF